MASFSRDPEDFAFAQERHVSQTLERSPIAPPTSLPKHKAQKGLEHEQKALRCRQAELTELGEVRAVECLEEAARAVENAQQFLAGSAG